MLLSLLAAAGLTALTFWIYIETGNVRPPDGVLLYVNEGYVIEPEQYASNTTPGRAIDLLAVLQLVLPVLFFSGALLLAVFLFWRLKLKVPLTILESATARIMENDLDFSLPEAAPDELGQLCAAFETMRRALLANNQKLWRQAEEQKRLNAAFSHDLRNPLTVLKGSAKMARRCDPCDEALESHLARIEAYTGRMERYVEIMSSVGRLGQLPLEKTTVRLDTLSAALEEAIQLITAEHCAQTANRHPAAKNSAQPASQNITQSAPNSAPQSPAPPPRLVFHGADTSQTICVDKNALFQVAENLIANALRFADACIHVSLSLDGQMLVLTVMDDGPGFPDKLLKNGIRPFQKGTEDAEHFGMGLYICALLCEKHGGHMEIKNICESAGYPAMKHLPSDGAQIFAALSVF